MNNFQEKLRSLRKEKGISQEKLANFLGVTFQAVSKWETGSAMPDIALLPDIARFFSITVDELLCVETIDQNKLYMEYENKAENHLKRSFGFYISLRRVTKYEIAAKIAIIAMPTPKTAI